LSLTGGGNESDLLAADITEVSANIARALGANIFIVRRLDALPVLKSTLQNS